MLTKLTSKERVKRAIHFASPDRVPVSFKDVFPLFHIPPQSWQPPEPYYPYVHPLIIKARLWKPKRKLPRGWLNQTRIAIDEWGTVWRISPISTQGEVVKGALEESWDLLESFKPPDFSDWSRFKTFARLSKLFGGKRYRLAVNDNSLWERFRFLRGFENAMMDLIYHPSETRRLLEILTNCHLQIVENFKKAGADGFMLVDDWGTQDRTFISPKLFDKFFRPCYQRIVDRCHELGMDCGIHSCGNIRLIIPSLIEIGFDFLQLDSPNMCGIDWLAENAGGKIALFCSPDIQEVYIKNDPELLRAHIKEQILKLADFNGGFAGWPYAEWRVIGVKDKIHKLAISLYLEYGKYPLDKRKLLN